MEVYDHTSVPWRWNILDMSRGTKREAVSEGKEDSVTTRSPKSCNITGTDKTILQNLQHSVFDCIEWSIGVSTPSCLTIF